MTQKPTWILGTSFLLVVVGFLLPLWPLSVVGILLAAWSRHFTTAILLGFVLDIAWGVPTGMFSVFFMPFTLLAVVSGLFSMLSSRYVIDKTPRYTL